MKRNKLLTIIFIFSSIGSLFSCSENKCNHNIINLDEVLATCTEDGHSSYSYCDKCGEFFEEKIIYKAHHDYKLKEVLYTQNNFGKFVCSNCNDEKNKEIETDDINMPILYLNGDISKVSKDKKTDFEVIYESEKISFESKCTLKLQGANSLQYPKKNFNIAFLKDDGSKNKIKLIDSVGKQSKYTLKANYVDFSQSRNIVGGRVYNDIIHSLDIDDDLFKLENGGVVDGYPVLIYINNNYQGLYTLNISKDGYMFGMKDEDKMQAVLSADTWNDVCYLKSHVNEKLSNGFELEYCSTEDTELGTKWVSESFNRFIDFLNNSDNLSFKTNINNYTSLERTIDHFIYSVFLLLHDNLSKNILYATFDGEKWYQSMYDMDGSWGLYWNGDLTEYKALKFYDVYLKTNTNILWKRVYDNFYSEIKERYLKLRKTILKASYLENRFKEFFDTIPEVIYDTEKKVWTEVPSQDKNNFEQIKTFIQTRIEYLDAEMKH